MSSHLHGNEPPITYLQLSPIYGGVVSDYTLDYLFLSSAAGIPDFRSPGSGLYDNLEKYKLPNPMAIFEIDYFRQRPEAFFTLAKELYPGSFKPTPCHYFIKLLHQKNLLLRLFTQVKITP